MISPIAAIIIIITLIILTGVVSSTEAAFFASSPAKIDEMATKGKKRAVVVQNMLLKPNLFLSTIQVINTLIAFVNGAIASAAFNSTILGWFNVTAGHPQYNLYTALVTIAVTVFLLYWQIIFGELVPKRIGMKWPEKVSMIFARFIQIIYYVMWPFIWFLTI
jgi:putative hemolysin